jgi:hypothetical protein
MHDVELVYLRGFCVAGVINIEIKFRLLDPTPGPQLGTFLSQARPLTATAL